MTGIQSDDSVVEEFMTEKSIVEFLRQNPEFFEKHGSLFSELKLPHKPGQNAVSLIERQVAVLRQENFRLSAQIREYVAVAKSNDRLAEKIHKFVLELMRVSTIKQLISSLETSLREHFNADRAAMILFSENAPEQQIAENPFFSIKHRHDPGLAAFDKLLDKSMPRCGVIKDSRWQFLFNVASESGSIALIPLVGNKLHGLIAIGNFDSTHFHPAMSTDFLKRIGEVTTAKILMLRKPHVVK